MIVLISLIKPEIRSTVIVQFTISIIILKIWIKSKL